MNKNLKKIFLNNFYFIYFTLLNIILAIKLISKYNGNINEYFVWGFIIFGAILSFEFQDINIKKTKRFTFIIILLLIISMLLLLILNYKHCVTNIFIVKNILFSIVFVLLIYVWFFLSYKYYKKGICIIDTNLIALIGAKEGDISILDFIFSILSLMYIVFWAIHLL